MFSKIQRTAFPPIKKPMMVWDGKCGFCRYWISRWKSKTGNNIDYRTFQEVAEMYNDIPLKEFKKASRLIETNGSIYSGPDSAFRSFNYFEKKDTRWHRWYTRYTWFTWLSDHSYNFIAKNRSLMFTLTKLCFGKNPKTIRPYWILWLLVLFAALYFLAQLL